MGVLTLDSYIRKNYKSTTYYNEGEKVQGKFKCLGLDANPFIYSSVYRAFEIGPCETLLPQYSHLSYEEKYNNIFIFTWLEIVKIVEMIDTEIIYIAFDGVAPMNKINQQRSRRYGRTLHPGEFDLCNISTGTKFMKDMCIYITHKLHEKGYPHVIFSGHNVPGEGEHKIMDHFRTYPPGTRVCMYGPDGDLIMLGLSCDLDFYLCKVDISTQYNYCRYYTICMSTLKEEIMTNLKTDIPTFVFLGFLLGNDFVPRLEIFYLFISGIVDLYKYVDGSLFRDGELCVSSFKQLMNDLSNHEWDYIKRRKEHPFPLLESSKDFSTFRKRYYSEWLHIEDSDIPNICKEYLDVLWWNWLYYTQGCPTFNYSYRHHYPPFICDLADALRTWNPPVFKYEGAKLPFHQLVHIMPKNRSYLLPNKYHHLFEDFVDPSLIKTNIEGRHPKFDAIFEVPIVDNMNIEVIHNNYHSRNSVRKDRELKLGNTKYEYTTKYGTIYTYVEG